MLSSSIIAMLMVNVPSIRTILFPKCTSLYLFPYDYVSKSRLYRAVDLQPDQINVAAFFPVQVTVHAYTGQVTLYKISEKDGHVYLVGLYSVRRVSVFTFPQLPLSIKLFSAYLKGLFMGFFKISQWLHMGLGAVIQVSCKLALFYM